MHFFFCSSAAFYTSYVIIFPFDIKNLRRRQCDTVVYHRYPMLVFCQILLRQYQYCVLEVILEVTLEVKISTQAMCLHGRWHQFCAAFFVVALYNSLFGMQQLLHQQCINPISSVTFSKVLSSLQSHRCRLSIIAVSASCCRHIVVIGTSVLLWSPSVLSPVRRCFSGCVGFQ